MQVQVTTKVLQALVTTESTCMSLTPVLLQALSKALTSSLKSSSLASVGIMTDTVSPTGIAPVCATAFTALHTAIIAKLSLSLISKSKLLETATALLVTAKSSPTFAAFIQSSFSL